MTVRAWSADSMATEVSAVAADLLRGLRPGETPGICLVACSVDVDLGALVVLLTQRLKGTALVGTTSCKGVASDLGSNARAAALFLSGEGFVAAAASGAGGGDDAALGERLASTAMARAGISAGGARFVVVHATPGIEEGVLAGLGRAITDDTVVIGGSGADDDLSGQWHIAGPDGAFRSGAAVLVCDWPWKMAVSYQGGYLATEHEGRITAAAGRSIITIDERPAADVYEDWLNERLPRGPSVLAQTTLHPLGVAHGVGGGLDVHVLLHPERLNDDGSITCFARVNAGDRVLLMESSSAALVRRGGLVSRFAAQQAGLSLDQVVAGLLIYCAGCSLAIGDEVEAMTAGVKKAFAAPFLMPFTWGEQGRLRRSRIDHGNLMLSALLLSTVPRS